MLVIREVNILKRRRLECFNYRRKFPDRFNDVESELKIFFFYKRKEEMCSRVAQMSSSRSWGNKCFLRVIFSSNRWNTTQRSGRDGLMVELVQSHTLYRRIGERLLKFILVTIEKMSTLNVVILFGSLLIDESGTVMALECGIKCWISLVACLPILRGQPSLYLC